MQPKKDKKILFITLSNIGDVILTTPALEILLSNYPGARITVLAGPKCAGSFEADPAVDKVMVYDKKASLAEMISLVQKLKKEGFYAVADMRHTLLPLLIGGRRLTSLVRRKKNDIHAVRDHAAKLIFKKKAEDSDLRFRLFISARAERFRKKLWSENGIRENDLVIGINPHAASSLKMWEPSNFAALMRLIRKERDAKFIIVGGDYARETAAAVTRGYHDAIDITGKTDLAELAAVIRKMSLLITCDSGPMHMASAFGVPTVAIFGPSDSARYGPFGNRHVVVNKKLDCSPCNNAQCAKGKRECIDSITVEEVAAGVNSLLI